VFSCRAPGVAAACALLALGACQPLPRPFAHDDGLPSAEVAPLADAGGVVVRGIEGVPPRVAAALTRAMIDAMAQRNIPAATGDGNARSRFLTATATTEGAEAEAGGPVRIDVSWALADRAGRALGTAPARMTVPRAAWAQPSHRALAPLAEEPARALAVLMQDPAPAEAPPSGTAGAAARSVPLHVWPVAGADGDGAAVLRRAMEEALARRGFRVTEALLEDGLVIAGSVALGADSGGRRPIEVEWTVLDGSGRELGKLAQKNAVPAAALERGWGGLAGIIAESAAPGVGALLARLPGAGS